CGGAMNFDAGRRECLSLGRFPPLTPGLIATFHRRFHPLGILLAITNSTMARIDTYFKFMKEQGASDLHLSTSNPPMLRINGDMVRIDAPPFANDDLK